MSDRYTVYLQDNGCEVSPTCLSCSLSRCKYDDSEWYARWRNRARYLHIGQAIYSEGLSPGAAAVRFAVTLRTVHRAKGYYRLATDILPTDDLAVFLRVAAADLEPGDREMTEAA